jgi:small nuclear ribonucleoprotein (snRNP)-like protein
LNATNGAGNLKKSMSFAAGGNDNRGDDVRKRKREADTNTGGSAGAKGRHNNNNNGDARTTLGSLLKYMEGYEVIVELKTGKRHRGRLASADDNMNLMLEDEKEEEEEQQQQQGGIEEAGNKSDGGSIDTNTNNNNNNNTPARQLFSMPVTRNIRGSKIRYVHFPDNANLPMLVRSGRERERNAANKYQKTKRTRK